MTVIRNAPSLIARILLLFCLPALAAAQPRIEITTGALNADHGKTQRRQTLLSTATLRNTGDQTLELTRVQKSCGGCSPLTLSRRLVPPGQTVLLTQRHKSGNKTGPQTRKQYLRTNDPTSPTLLVSARWEVEAYLDILPSEIDFGKKLPHPPYTTRLAIRTAGLSLNIRIEKIETTSPTLQTAKPRYDARRGEITIPVTVASDAPIGRFEETVTIRTNYKKEPILEIPVRGEILGPFATTPRYINFGVTSRGKSVEKTIEITVRPPGSAKITGMEYDKSILDAKVEPISTGRWRLRARLLPSAAAGRHKPIVQIQTSHPL